MYVCMSTYFAFSLLCLFVGVLLDFEKKGTGTCCRRSSRQRASATRRYSGFHFHTHIHKCMYVCMSTYFTFSLLCVFVGVLLDFEMKGIGTCRRSFMSLPQSEVAKALVYKEVLEAIEKHTQKTCWELTGMSKKDFTASNLTKKGGRKGETVTGRAVQKHWTKAKQNGNWFPTQKPSNKAGAGRPPQITQAQKQAIANKAMELKEEIIAPTPDKIRICLPKKTINKSTGEAISDWSITNIFKTMCYDESEDDPWQYLTALQQDCLTDEMKPAREKTADHITKNVTENVAWNFIAIDPCLSLLPRKQEKADLLKIAAMGYKKWMSSKSRRKGKNLRAPATAKTQAKDCDVVPWTPVFTRGCLKIVVLTERNGKLNSSAKIAAFVKNQLPSCLESMKRQWGWANAPKVILHDKASYFVDSTNNQVNKTFAEGMKAGRFKSWCQEDTKWLGAHLGDLYPHESVVSHVRRLLSTKFSKCSLWETPQQFAARMKRVEKYMNTEMKDSFQDLGKALLPRAEELKSRKGERIPK